MSYWCLRYDANVNPIPFRGKKAGLRSISQNRRDLPRDIPLDSVVVLRYEKRSKSKNKGKVPTEMELVLEQPQQEHQSDIKVFTMMMEILLEPTSNKLMVGLNVRRTNDRGNSSNIGRRCSYKTFMASKPKEFYNTKGVVGLMSWFENVESKLNITKCAEENKVAYVACCSMEEHSPGGTASFRLEDVKLRMD
ncbi:hypothetical protein Tco_1493974 [Tanacetum coccineum]